MWYVQYVFLFYVVLMIRLLHLYGYVLRVYINSMPALFNIRVFLPFYRDGSFQGYARYCRSASLLKNSDLCIDEYNVSYLVYTNHRRKYL